MSPFLLNHAYWSVLTRFFKSLQMVVVEIYISYIFLYFSAMSTNTNRDDLGPKTRNRSSSDTSKPNNSTGSVYRKPGVAKPHMFSQGKTSFEKGYLIKKLFLIQIFQVLNYKINHISISYRNQN